MVERAEGSRGRRSLKYELTTDKAFNEGGL
jgi:hypothetical protein